MHLTEDFPISSRLIRKTFRDEQKMNPNSARNIWKLLAQTRPDSNSGLEAAVKQRTLHHFYLLAAVSLRSNSQNRTPSSHCCLTRQPPCFVCALQLLIFCLHCSLMYRQANRSQL